MTETLVEPKNVVVFGGEGLCGWNAALELSNQGHDVTIVDNFSRRRIDDELGIQSLVPMSSMDDRLRVWKEVTGRVIDFVELDVAEDYDGLVDLLRDKRPDTVVNLAQQRSAPYSMIGPRETLYTLYNNSRSTTNLMTAQHFNKKHFDIHVVHLGTMGVYGYDGDMGQIPEGYATATFTGKDGKPVEKEVLYPGKAGSFYHESKRLDQEAFQFAVNLDRTPITDLHQGIVWGSETPLTQLAPELSSRLDYDGVFGTVLTRFIVQAAIGHPLTVHGTGGQTRAFISAIDSARCIAIAVNNPPKHGDRVEIFNQVTEEHRVLALAEQIVDLYPETEIEFVKDNPRQEKPSNELDVAHDKFPKYGLDNPTLVTDEEIDKIYQLAVKHADRIDPSKIMAEVKWQPEGIVF